MRETVLGLTNLVELGWPGRGMLLLRAADDLQQLLDQFVHVRLMASGLTLFPLPGARSWPQYAVLGPYDFVTILEAPDNETVAHLSVDLASRGTVRIKTLPAVPLESFINKLKSHEQLGRGSVDEG